MSGFVRHQLEIGSKQPVHKYRLCAKCEEMRPPEGGVDMSPSRWHCSVCWAHRATKRNLLNAKTETTRAAEAEGD
jgi:hypothetical protein